MLPRVLTRLLVMSVAVLATSSVCADGFASAVDEIAAKFVGSRTAGLAIAVAEGDDVLVDKGYGYADSENDIEATSETVFRIGSVTKQFTGVAIVQLMDAGAFALDDPITTILTGYPEPSKPVTVRHLLHHTSGIPSFTSLTSYMPNMPKDVTHDELIGRFSSLPLEFDPGAEWRYNNSGYYLLGVIVEKASGESYANYLENHLFVPAAMNHTDYETEGTPRAQGYRRNGDTFAIAGPISMTQPFAAGAIVSTAGDLVRWQRALVNGKLTPSDAFARITTDTVETSDGGERYGYGIGVSDRDGRRIVSHGGGINGFASLLAYFPETDHTIVILANTEGTNTGAILTQLTRVLFASDE